MFHLPLTHKRDAILVYLILEGAASLFFAMIFTVNLVYHVTVVELNPLQLVLVGTLLETVVFFFEVPTGIVADVYSRRLSVIIGFLLIGAGFMLEGAIPRFGVVLLAQLLWGLGATFTSGAQQAWIADEVGEERAGHTFMRGSQIGQIGGLAGIGLSVMLASIHIQLPIVLGGALMMGLGLFLLLVMPEDGFRPTPKEERESWHTMVHTLRNGVRLVRGRSILMIFLGVSLFYGLYSEGVDRLWAAHLLENFSLPALGAFKPVVWFGIISAVSMIASIGVTEISRRRVDTANPASMARTLIVFTGLMVGALITFGLARHFAVALVAYWIYGILIRTSEPLRLAWINQNIESQVRATVLSMDNQVNAVGQIAGGPAVGAIGTRFSLRAAMVVAGFILSPVMLLYARGRHPAVVPAISD